MDKMMPRLVGWAKRALQSVVGEALLAKCGWRAFCSACLFASWRGSWLKGVWLHHSRALFAGFGAAQALLPVSDLLNSCAADGV